MRTTHPSEPRAAAVFPSLVRAFAPARGWFSRSTARGWTRALAALFVALTAIGPRTASAEDAPHFLLGNIGVRVDLAESRWHMTRWSDDDLEAKVESDPILLYVWYTPVRAPVAPPDAWAPVFVDKIEKMQGSDAKVSGASVQEIGGRSVSIITLTFRLPKAGVIVLHGATIELPGKNLHLATVSPGSHERAASRDRAIILENLDLSGLGEAAPDGKVPAAAFGTTVKGKGVEVKLPDTWRPLEEGELSAVTSELLKLGLEDLTDCWTALSPHAGGQPDVMASCTRPLHLGVVDSYSFEGSELEVRKALFGEKAPPATQVDTPDRTGFLYAPREGLAMGVLPDNDRVQVVWALGSGDLSDGVRAVLQASTFAQPHTPAVGDQISYYVHHRPLSPVVLCPVGCLCAVGAVVAALVALVVLLRSRRRPSDGEDDA